MQRALTRVLLGMVVLLLPAKHVAAQEVELGGLAFFDYFYTLSSPQNDTEGLHGFTYRRLYLTSDFTLSDAFYGRARLEANDGTDTSDGPVPFVKDLWLAWRYAGEHEARIGVTPPPVFELAEDVWGYRSLEQTILDFQDVNTSRDFGLRFSGPLAETVSYAVMVANNNGVHPESEPYKRVYGQVEFLPTDHLSFSLGADRAGYDEPREGGTRVSAFGGYMSDRWSGGAEVYWHQMTLEVDADYRNRGVSLFGRYQIAEKWEVVGRLDTVVEGFGDADVNEYFMLFGGAYTPTDGVRLIPNLWWFVNDQTDDPEVLARVTVEVSF